MSRVKRGMMTRKRHNKVLSLAKGYRGAHSKLFRQAHEAVMHAGQYAYRDRRVRKRDFRALWISRINAAVRKEGLTYSVFMNGLKKSGVTLNRKALAELAVSDAAAFGSLLKTAKQAAGK